MNRILDHAAGVRDMIASGGKDGALSTPEQVAAFDESMAIDASEHFAFQEAQAFAHASGKLSTEEAQVIYMALGEVQSTGNGGWQPEVDTALKVTITMLVKELILLKMQSRMSA